MGTCPYRERCVYLHDPRLMCRGAQIKSRKKNKEDIVIDSLFWPVLPAEAVHQRLDCNGQPHVVQRYSVPAPQHDQFKKHDQAVYSMWQHFVTACGLLNMNAGGAGDYRCEIDTLAYMHPSFIAKHPVMPRIDPRDPRTISPTQAYYDPVNRMYHFTPTPEPATPAQQVPPLVALLNEREKTNAFVNTQRLEVFVKLSAGEAITRPTNEGSYVDQSAYSHHHQRAARNIPVPQYHGATSGFEPMAFAQPCANPRRRRPIDTAVSRPQPCQEYLSLSDLASAPAPAHAPASVPAFSGVLRPVAWSPPRGKTFVSSGDNNAARIVEAAEKTVDGLMDEDDELLAICGQLSQGPSPGPSLLADTSTSAFRQVVAPLTQPKQFPDLASISSPTTVADAFRDSPCAPYGKSFRFEGFEDTSELDQQLKTNKQEAAYEQTLLHLQTSNLAPVRLFSDEEEPSLSGAGEWGSDAWTAGGAMGAGEWAATH